MSRAKCYIDPLTGVEQWFDYKNQTATVEQLELLADFSDTSIDDLLDEGLGQKEVARRLHEMDGLIPEHVLENRRRRREEARNAPACRWCEPRGLECEGMITRHHFVPRWLMLMLENYQSYATRSRCTIPICLARHRDLHMRGDHPKSIADCLSPHERAFAQRMLDELQEQIPKPRWDLLLGGDIGAYEGQMIRDYVSGRFRTQESFSEADRASQDPSEQIRAEASG